MDQEIDEIGTMEIDAVFDQTCGGSYLSLDELGNMLKHLASLGRTSWTFLRRVYYWVYPNSCNKITLQTYKC